MSRPTGPIGKHPFQMAPRTPGLLGINDAASPDARDALSGDTPGSLGVNDRAGAITKRKRKHLTQLDDFLDSVCDWETLRIPGAPIAFDWPGHRDMTDRSIADFQAGEFKDFLPPSKEGVRNRLIAVLTDLSGQGAFGEVQLTDITLRQYTDDREQSTHFMAFRGQSQSDAYKAGLAKIWQRVDEAIGLFRNPTSDVKKIGTKLGNGLHPLQDSFSPTHCRREPRGDGSAIVEIFVWADQKKAAHEAGDVTWKNDAGGLSALGLTVVDATKMMLAYFVLGAVGKNREAAQKKVELVGKYFVASGRVAGP
jgi:hypothetical protein